MRKLILLALALPLAACSTLQSQFKNRVVCPVGKGPAYFISLYGPVGVSAEVAAEDSTVLCPPRAEGAKQ